MSAQNIFQFTRLIFISTPIDFIVSPVENLFLGFTPEMFWKIDIFLVILALPTGILRQDVCLVGEPYTYLSISRVRALLFFFLENVFVTFIDKTDKRYPEKRENYWIQTLSTIVTWGLDILTSVWATFFGLGWFLGKMMHQIKGIVALFKIIWKNFSFRLSSRINLQSKYFETFTEKSWNPIFYERKPSFSATQWYIYFSSSRTQTRVIAQTLRVYCNLSTIRFFT